MIMINLSETGKSVTIEVTGHGDDTDQSCSRVSTVLDCIQLFFSKMISDYKNGYTLIVIDKRKLNEKFLTSGLLLIIGYFLDLEKLYPKSIKTNLGKEEK